LDLKVGLIGVGNLGGAIAAVLVRNGFEVVACDIDETAQKRAAALGAKLAKSPAEVARVTDITLLALPFPSDVDMAVSDERTGLLQGAGPGFVIVDMSTVGPSTTRKNSALAARKSVDYIDAPVLGRPPSCGQWTLPVGGKKEVLEKCRPVLSALAKNVIHIGDLGSGDIIKLLNNMMFSVINATTAEILALSTRLGVDPRVVYSTISESGAATVSKLFLEVGSKILKNDFTPIFSIDLMWKDLDVALQMAREVDAPMIVTRNAQILNEMARIKGLGKLDTSAVYSVLDNIFSKNPIASRK
jgi:3-hydroxyisobutyrate dehydrogenase-like beta-hydroxyacid dehydrogenase